jgi:hypothetical protein
MRDNGNEVEAAFGKRVLPNQFRNGAAGANLGRFRPVNAEKPPSRISLSAGKLPKPERSHHVPGHHFSEAFRFSHT